MTITAKLEAASASSLLRRMAEGRAAAEEGTALMMGKVLNVDSGELAAAGWF